jgi:hypothetical protein
MRAMNPFVLFFLLIVPALRAQQITTAPADDHQLVLQLLKHVQALEAEVSRLKGATATTDGLAVAADSSSPATPAPASSRMTPAATAGPVPGQTPGVAALASDPQQDMDSHEHMMAIPDGPVLHFRGFFDLDWDDGSVAQNLQYPLGVPAHNSFRAGEFDLFMNSQLSEKLSFLAEAVFSTSPANSFAVDLERLQLTYQPSSYFQISGGRYHSAIGYYNTAYHHGLWFSTATGRPFMYYFEDSGGVLPVHEVGITATGRVPKSGRLNLHWIAEMGNGSSEFGSLNYGDGVESFASDRGRKDVNFAIYSRPQWFPGLQIGGSYMRGTVIPAATGVRVNQNVSSAYVVFVSGKWELLNEAVLLQHQLPNGGRSYNSPLGYTQISRTFGIYRPYFRFQEVNVPNDDSAAPFTGRYEGPSAGIRVDFFTYAALKLQYNRVYLRDAAAQNGFETQLAFTF